MGLRFTTSIVVAVLVGAACVACVEGAEDEAEDGGADGACGAEGCDPIVGHWRSEEIMCLGDYNTMTVDADLTGISYIQFITCNTDECVSGSFELDIYTTSPGSDYEVDLVYAGSPGDVGGADDLEFHMFCMMDDPADLMYCTADGLWVYYDFEWTKI